MRISRRAFFHLSAGAGTLAALKGQVAGPATPQLLYSTPPPLSKVAIVKGEQRRTIVHDALAAIDDQLRPAIARKKYVVIKVNNVSTTNQLAATHADAIWGILDYLQPRFKLPVTIAESSAGETMDGFRNFSYTKIPGVTLVDLNEEAKVQAIPLIDYDLHLQSVRLAARLLDPDAFVISVASSRPTTPSSRRSR